MYVVYVLRDERGRIYKGLTKKLKRRLSEHRRGKTISTRKMIEPKLIYKEEYKTFEEARRREKYLKTAAGRKWLKKNKII